MGLIRLAVACLAGLATAVPVLLEGRSASLLHRGNVVSAAAIRPGSPSALAGLAEQLAGAGRHRDAIGAAADALRAAPLDQRAARLLGLSLIADGRVADGRTAMALAGATGWRDTPTLLWQMRDAMARGAFDAALVPADALARRRRAPPEAFALVRRVAAAPGGTARVGALLRDAPPWRADFLQDVAGLPAADIPGFGRLLAATGATSAEVAPFVRLLADRGAFADARAVWQRAIPGGAAPGALATTDFAGFPNADATPFDWTPHASGDVAATADRTARPGRVALGVSGAGGIAQPVADQLALAAPGARVLTVEQGPGAADGLAWTVSCAPSGTPLALGAVAVTDIGGGWRRVARRFTVPASGCTAQRVALNVGSDSGGGGFATLFGRITIL